MEKASSRYPSKVRREIGIVPQELAYLDNLSVEENIDFFCGLYISDPKQRKQYVQEAIEFVELQEFPQICSEEIEWWVETPLEHRLRNRA